jgi:predicted TPR repeat methyltransferase
MWSVVRRDSSPSDGQQQIALSFCRRQGRIMVNERSREALITARYFFGRDDFQNAAQHCRRALAEDGANLDAMLLLGSVAEKTGAHEAAVSVFKRVLTIDPLSLTAHLGLGSALIALGKWADAAAAYEKAIDREPTNVDALNGLGTVQIAQQDRAAALASFERALRASPSNDAAAYMVAALKGRGVPPKPQIVRASFDRYAEKFESHLVEVLGYRMPRLMAEALAIAHPAPFAAVLDLGCGTGLLADAMPAERAAAIDGIDLAPRMIEETRKKRRYRNLLVGDIADYLRACPPNSYDLVVSADVFIYVGPLEAIFAGIDRVLTADGLVCFSVEHTDTANYEVQASSRYAHGTGYVDRLASQFGFERVTSSMSPLRRENGSDIMGRLELLRRAG